MGFGVLLKFNLEGSEKRDMLCFLMDRIDPVEMVISTGGGSSIPITPHAIRCILGIPYSGGDAPMVTPVAWTSELAELKRLVEVQQNSNIKNASLIVWIKTGGTDALMIRILTNSAASTGARPSPTTFRSPSATRTRRRTTPPSLSADAPPSCFIALLQPSDGFIAATGKDMVESFKDGQMIEDMLISQFIECLCQDDADLRP